MSTLNNLTTSWENGGGAGVFATTKCVGQSFLVNDDATQFYNEFCDRESKNRKSLCAPTRVPMQNPFEPTVVW